MAKYPYKNFSFKDLPIKWLLGYVATSVVGIFKVVSIYYNNLNQKTEVEYVEIGDFLNLESEIEILPFYPVNDIKELDELRSHGQKFEWLQPKNIGFDVAQKTHVIGNQDLFTELQMNVLVLKFRNAFDNKFDCLLLYFHSSHTYITPTHHKFDLSNEFKAMIAPTLYRLLLNRLYEMKRDLENFDLVSFSATNLYEEIEKLRIEKKELQKKYGDSLVNLCKAYLNEFALEKDYHFVLHAEAEAKIAAFTGDISLLKPAIEKAAFVAMSTTSTSGNEIILNDYQIRIEEPTKEFAKQEFIKVVERSSTMAINFLDELEKAAERLKTKKLPLTGSHMGNELNGVTHASITQKLNKHTDNILKLLHLYPKRWPIIRNEFKPFQNTIDRKLLESNIDLSQKDDQR